MRVGVPTWDGRVSPVLDTAERLAVVETGDAIRGAREEVSLVGRDVHRRAAAISELGLDVLVCGAVSLALGEALESAGLTVVPWISGKVDEVLEALEDGELGGSRFLMPGCCGGGRGGRRHRRGTRGRYGSEAR